MSTGIEPTITLTDEGEWWVAKDTETGVASQGRTREDALDNLDDAVQLYKREIGESIDTQAEEHAVLRDLGLDPEEIEAAREENDGLPECLR
jgi:predicted RNase H-like HicB family nuclease